MIEITSDTTQEVFPVRWAKYVSTCSRCKASILMAKTINGKWMPLDTIPRDGGHGYVVVGSVPTAIYDSDIDVSYKSHFAICKGTHTGNDPTGPMQKKIGNGAFIATPPSGNFYLSVNTVYKALRDLKCGNCILTIVEDELFMRDSRNRSQPICRECRPFKAFSEAASCDKQIPVLAIGVRITVNEKIYVITSHGGYGSSTTVVDESTGVLYTLSDWKGIKIINS